MRDHWAFAKGFVRADELHASAVREEADFVAAQQAAGLTLLAPGLVEWPDLLRPLLAEGSGAAAGQLTRCFETNTFFRQPRITGDLPRPSLAAWSAAFRLPPGRPWVLTLPSPYDVALRSQDERPGASVAALALEVADRLRVLVGEGVRAGAGLVRFHDPSVAYARARVPAGPMLEALATAARGHEAISALHITNGDPFSVPEVLSGNPVRGLSIEDPGRTARIDLPQGTRLTAAVLGGASSLVEDPAGIARTAASLAERLGVPLWGISNGWDLDHVPFAISRRKLAALGQAAALVEVAA